MARKVRTKYPVIGDMSHLTPTPFKGAYVDKCQTSATVKLYIDNYLIVYCPCGQWYWQTPAYKPEHAPAVKWFMETYFPRTRLRKSTMLRQTGMMCIEPITEREEVKL